MEGSAAEPIFSVTFNCDCNAARIDDILDIMSFILSGGASFAKASISFSRKADGLVVSPPLQSNTTAFFLVSWFPGGIEGFT